MSTYDWNVLITVLKLLSSSSQLHHMITWLSDILFCFAIMYWAMSFERQTNAARNTGLPLQLLLHPFVSLLHTSWVSWILSTSRCVELCPHRSFPCYKSHQKRGKLNFVIQSFYIRWIHFFVFQPEPHALKEIKQVRRKNTRRHIWWSLSPSVSHES